MMSISELYLKHYDFLRSLPGLSSWMYTDEQYAMPHNWPLKECCKAEKYRPYICTLKKGHPGPHISLVIWTD